MITRLANILGVFLLGFGILGFIPGLVSHGTLLETFRVNPALNALHLFAGGAAIWCGLSSALAVQVYFRFFGAVFGFVAVAGFFTDHGRVLGHLASNSADAWMHVILGLIFLVVGLVPAREPAISHPL